MFVVMFSFLDVLFDTLSLDLFASFVLFGFPFGLDIPKFTHDAS